VAFRGLLRGIMASLIFIISIGTLLSQDDYSDYTKSDKTEVYRENFSEPNSQWEVYRSGQRMGKIHDGVLDWISMNNSAQMIWHTLSDMDWSRDWQIEARVKYVTGKENSSNDLVWNIDENNRDKYHFGFTGQGKYVFSKKVGSEYQSIVPFTASDVVNTSVFNKITIRKKGNSYYYFFNEKLLTTKSYHTVTSNKVGFMVAPNTTVQIDYLDVSYLKPKDFSLASTLPSGMNYVGIMTKYNGYNLQRWKTRDNFPKDAIKTDWDAGYHISDLSYDNNKWSLVMSKGTGYSTQTWITRKDWPKTDIQEKWDDGFAITEVNYGNGVWAIVFSKGSPYSRQRWSTRSVFPSDKIKEFGDEGFWISEIAYGVDRWALVASKSTNIRGQKWFKKSEFPESEIKEFQNQGYAVTQLSRENNWWVLVMTKYSSSRPQQLIASSTFPKDDIRKYWDQGYYLTDLSYGALKKTSSYTSNTSNSTGYTPKNLKLALLGTWYGGAKGKNENGYFRFYSDDIAMMISDKGDTTGGYDYYQEGMKIDTEFETNSFNTPNQLDLVLKSSGITIGRLKGIIRFIDQDTFELKLSTELDGTRPSTFANTSNNPVATFKRVN